MTGGGIPGIPGPGIIGELGLDDGPACVALLTSVPALAIGGAIIGVTIGTAPGMFGTGIAYRAPGTECGPATGGGVGSRGWLSAVAAPRPSSPGAGVVIRTSPGAGVVIRGSPGAGVGMRASP